MLAGSDIEGASEAGSSHSGIRAAREAGIDPEDQNEAAVTKIGGDQRRLSGRESRRGKGIAVTDGTTTTTVCSGSIRRGDYTHSAAPGV